MPKVYGKIEKLEKKIDRLRAIRFQSKKNRLFLKNFFDLTLTRSTAKTVHPIFKTNKYLIEVQGM